MTYLLQTQGLLGAGGPVSYTLTADAGAYVLTGQSATLTRARTLTAASGSYALTGTASTFKHAYRLTAAGGSYTLTGQAAALVYTPVALRTLAANSGSFALTGQAAGLKVGRSLVAASGALLWTGQPVTLTYTRGYHMPASGGTFTLTGQAVTLTHGQAYMVDAEPGEFLLSGGEVTFLYTGDTQEQAAAGGRKRLVPTASDWAAYYRRTAGRQESGAAVLDSEPETNYGRISDQAERASEQLAWTQARQARYALRAAQDALWQARSDALAQEARIAQDALEAQRAFDELMSQQAELIWLMRQKDDEEALLLILTEAA